MKLREIFRFEFVYQARRVRTWLYFSVLFAVSYGLNLPSGGKAIVLSPFEVALDTVLTGMLWIWMTPAVAGSAAARDVQTRMHPLVYSAPISKADYLGGRFLAAFALNALILAAVPLGILAAVFLPLSPRGVVDPLRPDIFLSAYGLLALPTAFAFTAVQFSVAALKGRVMVSYLGNLLFAAVAIAGAVCINVLQMPRLGELLDPSVRLNVQIVMGDTWTPLQKNTVLVGLESSILANRLLWMGVAAGILVFTHARFRLGHRAE